MASKITCLNYFPQIASGRGTGVVCEIWALQVAVIPVPPWRSCELIPAKAKAFRAEAQSRREHKENKAAIYSEPLRLCVSARVQLFFHSFLRSELRSSARYAGYDAEQVTQFFP